jgi:type II secretory pathway pseudopilin PulG
VNQKRQRGFVLISVIVAVSLVLLTLLVASTYAQLGSRLLMLQLTYQGQALNIAQAGLVEGADWFRRQQTQPVVNYNPTRNLAANPPVDDTDIVTVPPSIQRDFLVSAPGRIWGHYEVRTGNAATGTGVLDVSLNRKGPLASIGSIWQLESTGVVYVRNDPNLATVYNQAPNQVLATKTVRAEVQKLSLRLPDNAGLSIPASSNAAVTIGAADWHARVVGGQTGRGVSSASGTAPSVNVGGGSVLTGTPSWSNGCAAGAFTMNTVFGVTSQSDIVAVADITVNNEAQLPSPLPPMQMIFINKGGNVLFNSTNPLSGSGILIVNGNLTIDGGPSSFNGVIYVTGTYTQNGSSRINGSVIVAGASAVINGGAGDFGEIYWDPFMFNQVQQQLSQYRFSRSGYVPCPSWDTNCNSRFAGS